MSKRECSIADVRVYFSVYLYTGPSMYVCLRVLVLACVFLYYCCTNPFSFLPLFAASVMRLPFFRSFFLSPFLRFSLRLAAVFPSRAISPSAAGRSCHRLTAALPVSSGPLLTVPITLGLDLYLSSSLSSTTPLQLQSSQTFMLLLLKLLRL